MLSDIVLDDEKRMQKQLFCLEIIFFSISSIMSIINIITWQVMLLLATGLMAISSLANAIFVNVRERNFRAGIIIFTIKMFALFTFFIITGGTEGFSTIWLLLLPTAGLMQFGRKYGSIITLLLFAELVIFFYTPASALLQCEYTNAFLVRFPIVYMFFYAVAFYLEYLRELIYNKMNELRSEAKYQSQHDSLTGLYNRLGFNQIFDAFLKDNREEVPFGVISVDIDKFKLVNDQYGHPVGDIVLKEIASRIQKFIGKENIACRLGGEEFAILIKDESHNDITAFANKLREKCAEPIEIGNDIISVTISVGGVLSSEFPATSLKELAITVDKRLYEAKDRGRNRCVCE